jgi:nucleosome binding factor SPN SPT16 subunit
MVGVCRQAQKKHQDDLLRRVNEETLRRAQAKDSDAPTVSGRKVSEVESYRTISDLPAVRDLVIQVTF